MDSCFRRNDKHYFRLTDIVTNRNILKSKIQRATITALDLDYEDSTTVDEKLLEKADILPGEQVHVLNIINGERFITYAIGAPHRPKE